MAESDDVKAMERIKSLTSSIRFENEDVRRQVELMLGRYQAVAETVEKVRDLTHEEAEAAKRYLAVISKIGNPLGEQVKGLNESSRALKGMEDAVRRYTAEAEKAETISGRLTQKIKDLNKERKVRDARIEPGEARVAAAQADLRKVQEHREGLSKAGIRVPRSIEDQNRKEEDAAKRKLAVAQKQVATDKAGVAAAEKRLGSLKGEKKLADQLADRSREKAKDAGKVLADNEKLLPLIQKANDAENREEKRRKRSEAGGRGGTGDYRRRGLMGALAVNVASDSGIPGLSTIARIERYRRLGAEFGRRQSVDPETGEVKEGGGGLLSALGGPAGVGLGIAAGVTGMAVGKVRQAMGRAEEMAPGEVTLSGQLGRRLGTGRGAYMQDLTQQGLSNVEAQRALIQLNREIGGRAGPESLKGVATTARRYGLDVGEVGGQAGGLLRAGGATPQTAAKTLERVMAEGVRAGVDRSRITEFTQSVISIQQDILKEAGDNNATAIARALGQFMAASGRKGAEFINGPEMVGINAISKSMQQFGHGGVGAAAGALYRAFSPSVEGRTPGQRFVNLERIMEGGVFGATPGFQKETARERMAPSLFGPAATHEIGAGERVQTTLGEYFNMAGVGDLFGRAVKGGRGKFTKAEEERFQAGAAPAAVMAQQQLGIGVGQFDRLFRLLESGKIDSKEGIAELKDITADPQQKSADALTELQRSMSTASNSLTQIANGKVINVAIKSNQAESAVNQALSKSGALDTAADAFSTGASAFTSAVKTFSTAVDDYKKGGIGAVIDDLMNPKPTGTPQDLDDQIQSYKKKNQGPDSVFGMPSDKAGVAAVGILAKLGGAIEGIANLFGASTYQGIQGREMAPPRPDSAPVTVPSSGGSPDLSGLQNSLDRHVAATQANTSAQDANTAATNANSRAAPTQQRRGNTGAAVR